MLATRTKCTGDTRKLGVLDSAPNVSICANPGFATCPLTEGKDVPWRKELFLESVHTGRDTPFQEGVREGNWKFVRRYDESDRDLLETERRRGYSEGIVLGTYLGRFRPDRQYCLRAGTYPRAPPRQKRCLTRRPYAVPSWC